MLRIALPVVFLLVGACDRSEKSQPLEPHVDSCPPASSPEALVQLLASTYQSRDYDCFVQLFPTPTDSVGFLFTFQGPDGPTSWDLVTLLRVHRRLFRPEDTPPGEPPVPPELWLSSISITLSPRADFSEAPEWYRENGGVLDSQHWRAFQASYDASILFDTNSETDYRVESAVKFVVLENLRRPTGVHGKFVFFRWEEIPPLAIASRPSYWSEVLEMYRAP